MVMMVIGDNIARAFSLVGALAIVRFRTSLRSSRDISSLVVGIACGVQSYNVAVIGTFLVSLTILALQVVPLAGLRLFPVRGVWCANVQSVTEDTVFGTPPDAPARLEKV